jgi:hypothetical protein
MKDFRFYLEYKTASLKNKGTVKNPGNHMGSCVAVYLPTRIEQWNINRCYEAASGVYYRNNPACCWGSVDPGYLTQFCKRIPERLAKEIHPGLIEYLNQPN